MFVKKWFIFNLFLFGKYMYNVNLIRNEFVVFLIWKIFNFWLFYVFVK